MPKVSVLMSVYNGEKYLKEAIKSILGQSFKDFEFIIINDGSIDKTEKIIKVFNDKRIVLINQENIGLTKSLNNGLKLAQGDYIARMDADDVALSYRLEKQVKFLDSNPHIFLVGSSCYLINESNLLIVFYLLLISWTFGFFPCRNGSLMEMIGGNI